MFFALVPPLSTPEPPRSLRSLIKTTVSPEPLPEEQEWRTLMWLAGVCGVAGLTGWAAEVWVPSLPWLAKLLLGIGVVAGGWDAAVDTWENLRKREIDIHFLMLAVAAGAIVINAWGEAVLLLFLFSASGAMEEYALDRTQREVGALLKTSPKRATVLRPEALDSEYDRRLQDVVMPFVSAWLDQGMAHWSNPYREEGLWTFFVEGIEGAPGWCVGTVTTDLRARVAGVLQRRAVEEGSLVKAGQPLFQIEPDAYRNAQAAAQAVESKASAAAALAKFAYERNKPIFDAKGLSAQEFLNIETQHKLAQADWASAKANLQTAQLNLSYASVPAPITGRIGRSLFTEGALVTNGQADPLAVISVLDPVNVDLQLRRVFQAIRAHLGQHRALAGHAEQLVARIDQGLVALAGAVLHQADRRVPGVGRHRIQFGFHPHMMSLTTLGVDFGPPILLSVEHYTFVCVPPPIFTAGLDCRTVGI